ncbi:MAG: AMP-binding protein [Chitinophagaceae bacterium]|nr:AMP-binding protein [Oligoflexus sp.]
MTNHSESIREFKRARDFLLKHRDDYETAVNGFKWPRLTTFNWATDWFDPYSVLNKRTALHILSDEGEAKLTFEELSDRSSRVAQGFLKAGLIRGDRVLLMMGNTLALWESMLACQKLGLVVIPTATQATTTDLDDRIVRGQVKGVVTDRANTAKFESLLSFRSLVTFVDHPNPPKPWVSFDELRSADHGSIPGETHAKDPFLLYFTSGTTAKPKLVLHTHESYPVGHLSTMYWIGITEGSIHQNVSSPGWAKHAWSSMFAPWNAGATVLVHEYARFQPEVTLNIIRDNKVNSLCAPPTVWRML